MANQHENGMAGGEAKRGGKESPATGREPLHELTAGIRNALAPISSVADVLERKAPSEQQSKQFGQAMHRQVDVLTDQVGKLEKHKPPPKSE